MQHPIATFSRFMYLNSYAFLLLFMGIGIVLLPLWKISLWFLLPQGIGFILCEKGAYTIFYSWQDKKRKYDVLMQKNKEELRPDTFKEYMQAPCGRLLTKIVLQDMGKKQEYAQLKKLRQPLITNIKTACCPQKAVVYIAPDAESQ